VEDIAEAAPDGMLDLDVDPKLAWALKNRSVFPVDVNRAPREMLLRVPGLGTKAVAAILKTRRHRRLRAEDLSRLTPTAKRAMPFVMLEGWAPVRLLDTPDLRARFVKPARQLDLFAAA